MSLFAEIIWDLIAIHPSNTIPSLAIEIVSMPIASMGSTVGYRWTRFLNREDMGTLEKE